MAVAKVAPLHVNLPTRGVRYSFSQVLQTELRKPMTIRLLAENTKVPSWTTPHRLERCCASPCCGPSWPCSTGGSPRSGHNRGTTNV